MTASRSARRSARAERTARRRWRSVNGAHRRSRLISVRLRLHGILACPSEIWLLDGEPPLALASARECVALEPFREEGYRRLMRIHAALGDRAEALRVYEACRALLAKELGTDPSPETQAVHQDVRDARSGRAASTA
ncbi:MAG: bacterial transcriptional activator domain-containing protein [Acidobacteria bacterium]|nr:bacterial transcriptional activator domain-containing protein [Acidobacteriota bacterium]